MVFGDATLKGHALSTWVPITSGAATGTDDAVLAEDVTYWNDDDELVFPDTRQKTVYDSPLGAAYSASDNYSNYQFEVGRFESYNAGSNELDLKDNLANSHAKLTVEGTDYLPHVANITRNVIIRSESATGTRGHTAFAGQGIVDIEYVRFQDLGRTTVDNLNSTTKVGATYTNIGTNQIGRYAVHIHHFVGPGSPIHVENDPGTDADDQEVQYVFKGNAIVDSKRWAMAVHDTNFGLIEDNVYYRALGSGVVTEGGNEIGNVINHNLTIGMIGNGNGDVEDTAAGELARGGSGFWFRRLGNYVTNNVAADSRYAGFDITSYNLLGEVRLPAYQGVDHTVGNPIVNYNLTFTNPAGTFENNTAYGMSQHGLWGTYLTGDDRTPNGKPAPSFVMIENFTSWNASSTAGAVALYYTANVTLKNISIVTDLSKWTNHTFDHSARGLDLGSRYENLNLRVEGGIIANHGLGIYAPRGDNSVHDGAGWFLNPTVITGSEPGVSDLVLKNYFNIFVEPTFTHITTLGSALELNDIDFQQLAPGGSTPTDADAQASSYLNVYLHWRPEDADLTRHSAVLIDEDGPGGDDPYRIYFLEQDDDLPVTSPNELYADGFTTTEHGPIGAPVDDELDDCSTRTASRQRGRSWNRAWTMMARIYAGWCRRARR